MAILSSMVYLIAIVFGAFAVALAAALDYAAFGFVGPLAIMTALVILGRLRSGDEYKGGFVAGSAGASAGASGAASCTSSSFSSCGGGDSSGGCSGGSAC